MRSLIIMILLLIPVCSPAMAGKAEADAAKLEADYAKNAAEYESDRFHNAMASVWSHIQELDELEYENLQDFIDDADEMEDRTQNFTLDQAILKFAIGNNSYAYAEFAYSEGDYVDAEAAWAGNQAQPPSAKTAYNGSKADYATVAEEAEQLENTLWEILEDLDPPE